MCYGIKGRHPQVGDSYFGRIWLFFILFLHFVACLNSVSYPTSLLPHNYARIYFVPCTSRASLAGCPPPGTTAAVFSSGFVFPLYGPTIYCKCCWLVLTSFEVPGALLEVRCVKKMKEAASARVICSLVKSEYGQGILFYYSVHLGLVRKERQGNFLCVFGTILGDRCRFTGGVGVRMAYALEVTLTLGLKG